jgi:hypothetical protein
MGWQFPNCPDHCGDPQDSDATMDTVGGAQETLQACESPDSGPVWDLLHEGFDGAAQRPPFKETDLSNDG